jgi:hypothetical protein
MGHHLQTKPLVAALKERLLWFFAHIVSDRAAWWLSPFHRGFDLSLPVTAAGRRDFLVESGKDAGSTPADVL